jgi:hypothetical protein
LFLIAFVTLAAGVAACGSRSSASPGDMVTVPMAITAQGSTAIASIGTAVPLSVLPTAATARPPTGAPPSTRTGPTTLTAADDGTVVLLHPGQSVTVVLDPQGPFSWHVPDVKGTSVKQVSASGGYPSQQPARATFNAVQPGDTALIAVDDTPCLHANPGCLPAQRGWQVTIIVS